jgi:ABC-2 type transport system ATP-binding protein
MSTDSVLWCQDLRKVYRSGFLRIAFTALEGLDLDVRRGEIFGFIGPNGAGKTTAIKCLMGLLHATSGQASILGMDYRQPACRARVGFLPERPYFYQHLTAREFLDFYGRLFDLDRKTRRHRIGELLERVNLTRFADVQLGTYSKGMLQRAGLAQALINDPELVVLDEPMSGLDPLGRALVRDVILEERARGRTVFFSSHILADVEQMADRVGILVGGKLRGCGSIQELVGDKIRHVDCTFHLEGDLVLPGKLVRKDGNRIQQRVGPAELALTLATIIEAGGAVLEVNPARQTLEEILVDEMERANPVNKKRLGVLN